MNPKTSLILTLVIIFLLIPVSLLCEEGKPVIFPNLYTSRPGIPSPCIFGTFGEYTYGEYITIRIPSGNKYAVIPVTQEDGEIYSCMYFKTGKGRQLYVGDMDFRSLGKTGLHSDIELDNKKYITGRKIDLINYIARPGRFSYSGFIGKDEDIISVLKNDNRIVKKLGFLHKDLAKPLFHLWNLILGKYIDGRYQKDITIYYNGNKVILNAEGGKGYQESIFHDEIEGRWNIKISRKFKQEEVDLLKKSYPGHTPEKMLKLQTKLTSIRISEMNPFYIMRYGFYEGNTEFRADPVAISLIFGLRSLKEIIGKFNKNLFKVMRIPENE